MSPNKCKSALKNPRVKREAKYLSYSQEGNSWEWNDEEIGQINNCKMKSQMIIGKEKKKEKCYTKKLKN